MENIICFAKRCLLSATGAFAIAGMLVFGSIDVASCAQALGSQAAPKPKFEVASIKPDKSGGRNVMLGVSPGGRFHAENVTLKLLIEMAYDVKDSQLTGGPKWINSEHYDIEAKPSDSVASKFATPGGAGPSGGQDQLMRLLVQSLLADRFKLELRRTTKELPIYALVVAKHGLKLHQGNSEPLGPSRMRRGVRIGRGELYVRDAPLTMLANALSRTLGRLVVDETGLKGNYDFTLKWTPEESEGRVFEGPPGKGNQPTGGGAPPMGAPPPQETNGPSIFTALQEQLGLKLKPSKGPVEVLVVDHVEQPSAN